MLLYSGSSFLFPRLISIITHSLHLFSASSLPWSSNHFTSLPIWNETLQLTAQSSQQTAESNSAY
jgi:hypothetical protein